MFGVFGICFSILVGQLVKSFSSGYFAWKVYPIKWPYFNILIYTLLVIPFLILSYYTSKYVSYNISSFINLLFSIILFIIGYKVLNILPIIIGLRKNYVE